MFATHSTSPSVARAANNGSWLDDSHDMLLNQDVLDYTSFSDDSHSPVLSIESFASQQHSPDLGGAYLFQDFGPLSPSSVHDHQQQMTFPPLVDSNSAAAAAATAVQMPTVVATSSSDETARQASLLHAYLTAQNQAYNQQQQQQQQQQQRWEFAIAARLEQERKQQEQQEKIVALQQQQQREQDQRQEQQQQLVKTQQADAESLARYLAQIQQVKREESHSQESNNMDCAEVLSDSMESPSSSPAPSSPSSSSVMAERSPSPEACNEASSSKCNNSAKSNRQLICFNCKVTQTPLWRRTPDRKHSLCNACGLYLKQYGAHRPLNVRHKLPMVLAEARLSTMPYARPSNQGTRASSPASARESSASSDSDSDAAVSASSPLLKSLPDLTKMYSEALLRPPTQKTTPPLMTAKQGIECANCSQTQTPLWRKNDAGEPICNACGLYAKLHNRDRPVTMRKAKITRRRRDWGGNLAHQAQAQAQALAFVHAQVQAQVQAQEQAKSPVQEPSCSAEASMVEEMSRRAQELQGVPSISSPHSSDSEDDEHHHQEHAPQQPTTNSVAAQKLSGNLIMDENKFSDMVGQMNAHQMNRFLSILESRCGVLRNRLLASTEADAQSNIDHLF